MRRGRLSLGGGKGELNHASGEALVDRGSVFQTQIMWPVKTEAEAEAALATMKRQSACAGADHNMAAYRFVGADKKVHKRYDDDGEAHGGQRLLGCLTKQKAVDVAVVCSRVYGGQNLGKARFQHIVNTAAHLLEFVGHVPGQGIAHDWGGHGVALGGSPIPSSAGPAGSKVSSGGGSGGGGGHRRVKRKAAAAEDERAAKRAAMAAAAERRLEAMKAGAAEQHGEGSGEHQKSPPGDPALEAAIAASLADSAASAAARRPTGSPPEVIEIE